MQFETLEGILTKRKNAAGADMYIEGDWVERVPTVPVDGGIKQIVAFADKCWKKCLELQLKMAQADRQLAIAEAALRDVIQAGNAGKDLLVALAAVQAAMEKL